MQSCENSFLRSNIKINKQIAATDKIHTRKRRVAQNIVWSEYAHFTKLSHNLISVVGFSKKTLHIFFGNSFYFALQILANAGIAYYLLTKVGAKNLYRYFICFFILKFRNQHVNGIYFL